MGQPRQVHVQPRQVYEQPQTVYYGRGGRGERNAAYGDWDHDGIPNKYDRHPRHYDARGGYRQGAWPTRTAMACQTATIARRTTPTATDRGRAVKR